MWCRPGTFRVRVEDDDDAERGEHEFSTDELDVAINAHYSYRLRVITYGMTTLPHFVVISKEQGIGKNRFFVDILSALYGEENHAKIRGIKELLLNPIRRSPDTASVSAAKKEEKNAAF